MDKDEKIQEDKTLEELFAQLEDAIRKMEKEDISLEDSFNLYHKGMDMLKLCNEKIDAFTYLEETALTESKSR